MIKLRLRSTGGDWITVVQADGDDEYVCKLKRAGENRTWWVLGIHEFYRAHLAFLSAIEFPSPECALTVLEWGVTIQALERKG